MPAVVEGRLSGEKRELQARFICAHAGAPLRRCECCLANATQTVIFKYTSGEGKRIAVAVCRRHANMAAKSLRRFLCQRANRDRYYAETMAAMAQPKAG